MHQLALSYRVIAQLLATVSLFTGAIAAPLIVPRQSITVLSAGQISTYTPYTWFSSTGYCSPATTLAWDCGGMFCSIIEKVRCADDLQANCNANPGFHTVASGGDGDNIQYWFVGYSTTLGEIIVSHQGTNPNDL